MLNMHIATSTVGAGLISHLGLCVGAIQLRNTEDCFNSDLSLMLSFVKHNCLF